MARQADPGLVSDAKMRPALPTLLFRAAGFACALLAAPAASAASYVVNIGGGLDLQSVATAAAGDTVFRINPSSGAVTVQSGAGRRLSTTSVRGQVTITCKPSRPTDTACTTANVPMRIGTIGPLIGRARALTNFTVAMGTASVVGPPTGTNPLGFQLAPPGDNTPKTFFVGADFPVAGDDAPLASGNGENSFYVYAVDPAGLEMAGDSDKGKVKALRALAVAKTADLSFGRIQIPPSGASTISLNASTGTRTVTGGAFAFPTPAPTRGAFTVTGEGGQQVSLTIPTTFNLTGPSTIPVTVTNTAPPSPSLSGGLGSGGTYSFTIGGSFAISNTTPTGAYSGVLTVSIDYN
ncbi:DUF4402 domain-containing protein [Phenylobacterium sp.]|uniref:DUF4402 domain-containing protein n=1 Tax=Phenylobacterium sp. TaxID=1871053 RepID=UPI0025D8E893|nr:DUF4402 domain-containing protein [Phenylobacterium sp.]